MNDYGSNEIKVEQLLRLLKIVTVGVVVGGIIFGAIAWKKNAESEAAIRGYEALFEVEKVEQKAMKEAQLTSSNPLDVFKSWPESKKKEYLDMLADVQSKYSDSSASAMAGLKIARWHFEEKNYDKAVEAYQSVFKSPAAKKYPLFQALSTEGMGSSLENLKKYDEALKSFEESLNLKTNPLKPLAYLGKARNLKALGKVDEAKKTYEALIAEFPATPYEKKARVLMETLSL